MTAGFSNPFKAVASQFGGSLAVRSIKYGYSNARTKAMYATLLSKKEMDSLIDAKNISEIVALLSRTYYAQDLVEEAAAFSKADLVEISLGKNFSRALKRLVGFSPKSDAGTIMEIFERYDLLNIKNLLLGIHLKEPKEKIRLMLLESPRFNSNLLKRLSELGTVRGLVESLKGTDYYRVLDRGLLDYEKTRDIQKLAAALENFYYQKFSHSKKAAFAVAKSVKRILQSEIDAKNIMVVLRSKKESISLDRTIGLLIGGGQIRVELLKKMAEAKTVEDALAMQGRFDLSGEIAQFKKDNSLSPLENALDEEIAKEGLRELRRGVLSLSAIVGFLFLKERETKNIRKIVRTKEFGFSAEEIRKLVVAA